MATHSTQHSHLFTVRLWLEDLGDGQCEWRGQVKDIESGEEGYFRDWEMMPNLIQQMLPMGEGVMAMPSLESAD